MLRLAKVLSVISGGCFLLTPLIAVAQPSYYVYDANDQELGALSSSAAISQGVIIRLRSYDGTMCGGDDNDCEDAIYLLVPWTDWGPGYPTDGDGTGDQLPTDLALYYTDSTCTGQPYLQVQSKTNSQSSPYDVIGSSGNIANGASYLYYPDLSFGAKVETASQLSIAYTEQAEFDETGIDGKGPAYEVDSICVPAWVEPSALFAEAEQFNILDAMQTANFQSPYSLVDPPSKKTKEAERE